MRYVQQSPYGGTVPYRESPYTVRNTATERHQVQQQPTSQAPVQPSSNVQSSLQPSLQTQSQQQHQQTSQHHHHHHQQSASHLPPSQHQSSQQQQTSQQQPLPPSPQPGQHSLPQQSSPLQSHQKQPHPPPQTIVLPLHVQPSQGDYLREPTPLQIRGRISLRPQNAEYMPGLSRNRLQQGEQYRENMGPSLMSSCGATLQLDGIPPFKKIRLGEVKPEIQQPLRIDTREQPAYNPKVENISPTLPPDASQDDATFRSTKDDLLQQITKVDREITKTETQITNLKKKKQELEKTAHTPEVKKEEEETAQPKHQSQAQKIYAENRRKSQDAHALLDKLGPKVDLPLYNQPSDTAVYHENKLRHFTFKHRLVEHLKIKHKEKEFREKYLTTTYSKMMQDWLHKVERIESSQKRKAKEAKNREFFEKVFPELRKQREDRERFNRVGARIKSEADLEEIMDGLQEQENEDKKMRSYAVIPPILLPPYQREVRYKCTNGLIEDFAAEYKERQLLNVWTDSERDIFKDKYLQHPKNFGVIASYLERKNVCECVQYYYLSKKTENYKQLLRKSRQRTRASRNNPHAKPNSAAQNVLTEVLSGAPGVTTRLQREQQAKQEQPNTSVMNSVNPNTLMPNASSQSLSLIDDRGLGSPVAAATTPEHLSPPTILTATTTIMTIVPTTTTLTVAIPTVASATIPSSVPSVTVTPPSIEIPNSFTKNSNNLIRVKEELLSDSEIFDEENKITSEEKHEIKKKDRRKEGKRKKEEMETSDEECLDVQDKGVVHHCIVCNTLLDQFLHSRRLPRSDASLYGLSEEQVTPGARVCNMCRCKSLRSRYTHCPLPTCPNAKGKVKRLRFLPAKWAELPASVKDPIIAEFKIPEQLTKCCSVCFSRISRRILPHVQNDSTQWDDSDQNLHSQQLQRWTEEEIEAVKVAFRDCGTNWSRIAECVGGTKTHHQCKNFYFNYRKKLGLDMLVQEFNKNHLGEERKPTLTDEEESGSSTSSCDEISGVPVNSDTDSAASPNNAQTDSTQLVPVVKSEIGQEEPVSQTIKVEPAEATSHNQSHASVKEDYDSSATETADEGQGGTDCDSNVLLHQSPKGSNYNMPSVSVASTATSSEIENSAVAEGSSPTPVRSVKDLLLEVIEKQIMKNPGGHVGSNSSDVESAIEPTISSILKTDHLADIHRSSVSFGRDYRVEVKSRQKFGSSTEKLQTCHQAETKMKKSIKKAKK